MWYNYVLMAGGAIYIGFSIFFIITKRINKKRLDKYTLESLIKAGRISNILDICTGICIVLIGASYDNFLLPSLVTTISLIVAIVLILADTFIEPKILVKKEENKE